MASEIVKHKVLLKEEDFGFARKYKAKVDESTEEVVGGRVTLAHKTSNKPYIEAAKEAGFTKVDLQNYENFNNEFARSFLNNVAKPAITRELSNSSADEKVTSVEVTGPLGVSGTFTVSGRAGELPEQIKSLNGKEITDRNFVSVTIKNRRMLGLTEGEVKTVSDEIKEQIFKKK